MDWNELFQEGTTVPPGPGAVDVTQGAPVMPQMTFGGMQSDLSDIETAHVPVKTPQELEKRKSGWMEVMQRFESNPNLQRALFLMGAQLAQPIAPGQTTTGAIANAGVVGLNAYQQGQQADLAKQMALRKEGREDKRLDIEGERLGIERERTGLESRRVAEQEKSGDLARQGAGLDIDLKKATFDDLVAKAAAERKNLEVSGDRAAIEKSLKSLELINKELETKARMPHIATQVQQEIDLNTAKIEQLRGATSASAAAGRKAGAETTRLNIENKTLEDLSPEDRVAFLTKSGRFATGGTGSALEKQRDVWTKLYQGLPSDDPRKAGKNEAQFVTNMLSESKKADDRKLYIQAKQAGLTDDEIDSIGLKPGGAPAAAGAAKPAAKGEPGKSKDNPLPWPGEAAARNVPTGTYILGPNGIIYRKK